MAQDFFSHKKVTRLNALFVKAREMDKNRIIKIAIKFADGREYELPSDEVDMFFKCLTKDSAMLIGFCFTPNLAGGLKWQKVK